MPRYISTTLAAVVLALALAAPAPAATRADITHALTVADAAWPDSPCAGHINIVMTPVPAPWIALAVGRRFYSDGTTELMSCDVDLDPRALGYWNERLCEVLVHEAGHLAGHRHEPGGIMDGGLIGSWPACHPPHLSRRQRGVEVVQRMLPRGFVWAVRCTPDMRRCRALAPFAHPRRYAVRVEGDWATASRID